MIQRPTLHVLAEAAEIGLPEAAAVPASAFDPILRPFIKKNVARAVAAATARTTSPRGDHVLRLAFLDRLGSAPNDLDPNDERAVEKAFDTLAAPYLPPRRAGATANPNGGIYREPAADRDATSAPDDLRRPKRRWPITVPAAIIALLSVLATVATFVLPRVWPTPAARFRKTPFGKALGEPLTDVVVDSDRFRIDGAARAKILGGDVRSQIGEDAYRALESTVDELPRVGRSTESSIDRALADLYANVNQLDAKLAAAKVPAHLHAYGSSTSGGPVAWLTSYFVEQREELAFDGMPVRFVWGRRIDGLNLADNRLYKAHAEDWAIVAMDLVEEELVQTLLAPLAIGAPLAPSDAAPAGSPRAELSITASRVVVAELVEATHVSRADAASLHHAIAQRNEIAGSLAKLGYRLPATSGIELSASTQRFVMRAREGHPREEALLEDYLRLNDRAAGYRRDVAPAVAALTRIEEEELGGYLFEQKRVATVSFPKLGEAADQPRARALVATSLAMLARPQECTKLALWRMLLPAFDAQSYDGAASMAASMALLNALKLGRPADPFLVDEDDAFMRAFAKALELPPARIREAAEAAYKDLFGHAAPSFVRKTLR
jgi:hypothetical protein